MTEKGNQMKKVLLVLILIFLTATDSLSYPVHFKDAQGKSITVEKSPSRVVSLVPGITQIIFELGAGDAVMGLTHHDTYPPDTSQKEIVGGFFSPSLKKIEALQPDMIFISDIHKKVTETFGNCLLLALEPNSISEIYDTISLLGQIFDKEKEAVRLIDSIKEEIGIISLKIKTIPESGRKRVIRLMGETQMMTPGDDSFQNEYIKLAGGIPPHLNKKGKIVAITKEEWMKFNPQVIYGCEGDKELAEKFFSQPGWKDADAVKNGKIFYFPCDLTCRASSRAGYFVSWLASGIYSDEFEIKENQAVKDHVIQSLPIRLDLNYVKKAEIIHSYLNDFIHKTLSIEFSEPLSLLSTLEGFRQSIGFVGNSYSPPQLWAFYHKIGFEKSRNSLYTLLNRSEKNNAFLFTGADMDNLSVRCQKFKDMEVYALVTAGVKSNAVRMSKDTGSYYEPGTVNIILLSNMKLSDRAMSGAVISATEAKTAALWDMDIRSTYTPLINPATGTGTDNIIVVQGSGKAIDLAGAHTKMGELIAKAVYEGVQEAVYRQNGLVKNRDIFERLKERNITVSGLIADCECGLEKRDLSAGLEEILLEPRYAAFLESAFALSDPYEQGLIADLTFFKNNCDQVSEEIAGHKIENAQNFIAFDTMPQVLRTALNALLNGIVARIKQ